MAETKTDKAGSGSPMSDLLAACLLYWAISEVAGALTAVAEAGMGFPKGTPTYQSAHFENSAGSLLWMTVLCVASAAVWRYVKPSPKIWTVPFLLATGWWWLSMVFCDDVFTVVNREFSCRMFYACGALAFMGVVLSMVRMMLGEGRQQTQMLKRLFLGDAYDPFVSPKETLLLRATSLSDASRETLLRPTVERAETAPEQLLRAGQED